MNAEWLAWLEQSAPAVAMRTWPWLYPSVEIGHIVSFVILVGSVAMFDLRLLGFSSQIPVTALARHLLGWANLSFVTAVATGALLFSSDALAIGVNPAFQIKLGLITLGVLNAALFHLLPLRSVQRWDQKRPVPPLARLIAVFSLGLWLGVIVCGRLIAYL